MAGKIIVRNPAILSGEPVFRGTRVPFKALTDPTGSGNGAPHSPSWSMRHPPVRLFGLS
jgi:Protein of unknown function (DUF433)